jgi:hypothetical protein
MPAMPATLLRWFAVVVLLLAATTDSRAEDIRVTVVAILASTENTKIDPQLKCIAEKVQEREPTLKGFRVAEMTNRAVAVGKEDTFKLVEDQTVVVVVKQGEDKDNKKVGLEVKPPLLGKITYVTCCGKYFPIVTRYLTKDKKERLIIAIKVEPCPAGKK